MTAVNMPPRQTGAFFATDDDSIAVGKLYVAGAGLRVGLNAGGKLAHMSSAGARRMAADFDTPEAHQHGLAWVAEALREYADEVEAARATKQ